MSKALCPGCGVVAVDCDEESGLRRLCQACLFGMRESAPYTVILEVVVGSTAHGVAVEDGLDDLDLMAVCVETMPQAIGFQTRDVWVQRTKPDGVRSEAGDVDRVVYGLRKFIGLALRGNPSILLAFFVQKEHTKYADPWGKTLQSLADRVVSKQCFTPYRGYMRKQHERLLGLRGQKRVTRPELVARYGIDTKYAAHIVRLGFQGEELLLTGRITLPMPVHQREFVRSIRLGKLSLFEISEEIERSEHRLVDALAASKLPEEPDCAFMEEWMVGVYQQFWSNHD